jgi:hypothetical protein
MFITQVVLLLEQRNRDPPLPYAYLMRKSRAFDENDEVYIDFEYQLKVA